jgi:hypothetical protein
LLAKLISVSPETCANEEGMDPARLARDKSSRAREVRLPMDAGRVPPMKPPTLLKVSEREVTCPPPHPTPCHPHTGLSGTPLVHVQPFDVREEIAVASMISHSTDSTRPSIGTSVDCVEGVNDGESVGAWVGLTVGVAEGLKVGDLVGLVDGANVGKSVGAWVGLTVGVADGLLVGLDCAFTLGAADGALVGFLVGAAEGATEGAHRLSERVTS